MRNYPEVRWECLQSRLSSHDHCQGAKTAANCAMIRGVVRLKRVIRRVLSKYIPSVFILVYHRVAKLSSDPQLLAVSLQHFTGHLEI